MQQVRVIEPVMSSRCSELLALRDFGIGVRFNEIRNAVGREAKVDARVSIEPQCSVDAFCYSLNTGGHLRRKVLGRPIHNSDAFLITGIVFDFLGGYVSCARAAHGAEFQFPNRQNSQPVVAEDTDIELTSLDILLDDGIPAALITGIRSDLPGQLTAQVTENIFDTPTGLAKLVPQGARLIGIYDSQVAFGQSRVSLVWTRLIMPNGRSIVLERQQGADAGGYAGLEDEVDNHWAELLKAALLSTILGVGAELGAGADNGSNVDILQALRLGAANSLNQTGQQITRRNLNIQPTLTVKPGFPVRVIVNRDLILEPYRGDEDGEVENNSAL